MSIGSTTNLSHRAVWMRLAFSLLVAMAAPATSMAQPADGGDPPARVGRVADVQGSAWTYDSEAREWTQLQRNQTIAAGDHLRTDAGARVVLRIGMTSLYLDGRSELGVQKLDEGVATLELVRGDLGFRVRQDGDATDLRVITQQGQAVPESDGLYRVSQLDRGSMLRTWRGRLRFEPYRDAATSWVEAGDQLEVWWADGGQRAERQPLRSDAFGDYVLAQARLEGEFNGQSFAQNYVSPDMTGAEDLDRYGNWTQSDEYGPLWAPAVIAMDWAPYRYGHWAWTRYWGWTWVDDAPWGFAPFHYGRWVQYRGRWCWSPGVYVRRPVYAPALVAWGGAGGVSIGVSMGFGRNNPPPRGSWAPLTPRQAYVPAYQHSQTYERRINGGREMPAAYQPANDPRRNGRNNPVMPSQQRDDRGPGFPRDGMNSRAPLAQVQPVPVQPAPRPQVQMQGEDKGRGPQRRDERDQPQESRQQVPSQERAAPREEQRPRLVEPAAPARQPQAQPQQRPPREQGNERGKSKDDKKREDDR